ncbi:MAG TPA: EamA family transporter [Bacillota bacterium]|nr:EamA family transporter [Bacillota bacterium]
MRYYAVTALGVVSVSFAAIFIRMADAHPTSIALMRMLLATLFMGTLWLIRRSGQPQRDDWPYLLGAGVFLALHFYTWIASFQHTTVVSSVVLVSTTPLFVVVLSSLFLKERIVPKQFIGLTLCVIGAAVIGLSDIGSVGDSSLLGNSLALAGALFAAMYWLIGRKVRRRLPMLPYTTTVYGVATLVLLVISLSSGLTFGPFSRGSWSAFFGLAIVCTVLGHSSLNYAIGNLSASFISVAALGEPIGAAIWAALFFAELPTAGQISGGLLVLAGIGAFALTGKTQPQEPGT